MSEMLKLSKLVWDWVMRLTAGDGVPGSPVDDVVVLLEILVVAKAAVGVGHHQVGGGVDGGQPAEESVVRRGRVLLRGPVPGAVVRVRHHQLPPVQVGAEHEGNLLHPVDDSSGLRGDLGPESRNQRRYAQTELFKTLFSYFPEGKEECAAYKFDFPGEKARAHTLGFDILL